MARFRRFIPLLLASLCCISIVTISAAQQFPESTYQDMRWRMIGPFRGGRTRAASGVANEPNVFYIGQADGGVWKSDDSGRTWNPIFDGEPTQSIGAIAVAPSDPNIIYVGSGEGLHRPDLSVGDGIYRSDDAGKTWKHFGLDSGEQIPALAVNPQNSQIVFAAVLGHPYGPNPERGIFRSMDGGQTWQKVLYKDDRTGGSDVEIDPSNPQILYASLWQETLGPSEDGNEYNGTGGGLFKSTDGGNTWNQLTKGLPKDLVQIDVAIAASEPSRLYATISTTEPGDYASGKGLGFYRSDDGGENWYSATSDPRPAMKIGGGDLPVPKVDPKNADVVYSASIVTMRSTDGGKTWTGIRGAPGGDDYQNLWINPNNPNIILLVSDQGAIVTVNGGQTWSSWYNQPTAQLYHVSVSNTFPYRVCAGQQESGSVCISSRGNDGEITFRDWHPVGAIEYGYVTPDPLDPDIIYGGGRTEVSKFHWSTGQVEDVTPIPVRERKYRADRTEPVMFSPVDPHTLYYATNFLFKTTDGGQTWQTISPDLSRDQPGIPANLQSVVPEKDKAKAEKIRGAIYALAPSFKTVDTIWAGTDDGSIWLTRNGGKKWDNITPKDVTPWSKVTQMTASHFDDVSAYASVSRFRIDDLRPYIYRTHDGGKMWQLITAGLPDDAPVDTVREDPVRKGLLFAGTETGVWVSFDDGDHWQSLQLNLPHTSMRDLWIHDDDLIVATHGRSFWILDDITPLRQITASVAGSDAYLFQPAPAYRVRRDTNTDTPLPPDVPAGQNPPDGAILDYFLSKPASGTISLEILDSKGQLVRRYASADQPQRTREQLEKQLIPLYWLQPWRSLATSAGMHRWVWDLHYPDPESTQHEYPISAVPHETPREALGPLALPGQYTARLTADGHTYTAAFAVKIDPRVKATPTDLEEQFRLETRLAADLTRCATAVREARSVHEQLDKLSGQTTGALNDSIKALDKKVSAILNGPENPPDNATPQASLNDVNGKIYALYNGVRGADAKPTEAQTKGAAEIERDLATATKQWDELKAADLPPVNQQLRNAKLPEIRPQATPEDDEEDTNVDEG